MKRLTIFMGGGIICKVSSFEFKKKACAVLILTVMMINGFGVSGWEAARNGKWSAALVVAAVGQNIIVSTLGKCNKALASISKEIGEYIEEIILGGEEEGGLSGKGKGKEGDGREGRSGSAIVSEQRKAGEDWKGKWISGQLRGREIVNLYMEKDRWMGSGGGCEIVLIFIIFIACIRHRKGLGEIGASIRVLNRRKKIKISA
jgi:hypothetical protein